ncbi:MAG: UDP-2,3-diacylglucosamine diphosphatase [Burkholderiales bacterium]
MIPDSAPPPLPRFCEVSAQPSWRAIDFISDLHLASTTPRAFAAFSNHLLNTPADAVFILGDLFDAWVGDDARHHGFEAQCTEVLAEATARITVAFMAGNRDFLVGSSFLSDCGVMALADPSVLLAFNQKLLLSHGDALCLSDLAYQRFRAQVRTHEWQTQFLSQSLNKRQNIAQAMRLESMKRHQNPNVETDGDIDTTAAVSWMHGAGTSILIHGHTHQPGSEPMAPGFVRHVLSDWDLDGVHHGAAQHRSPGSTPRAEVLRLTPRGISRLSLDKALLPLSFAGTATHPARSA